MGRDRRNRSRGASTRRWFLAGGALIVGGVAIGSGSRAFSQFSAERRSTLETTGDGDALLGLDRAASVRAGVDDQRLVDLTNNTDTPFEVSISLANSTQGRLSPAEFSLASDATRSVAVSVAGDSPTGDRALSFDVAASSEAVTVALARTIAVTDSPSLSHQIRDRTQYGNAAFTISYRVRRLAEFDRIEIEVENVDAGYIEPETYVRRTAEGTVTYPPGGGNDDGVGGHTYEFRFRVYDASGEVSALYTETSTAADGDHPPGDDLGDEDDPRLVGFTATNDVQHTNNRFTVDYEVDRLEEFGEVQVTFDNAEHDWSDRTKTSDAAPMGTVVYPASGQRQGGVDGDPYDVTVAVYNRDGIPVDDGTVRIHAGSNDAVEWP